MTDAELKIIEGYAYSHMADTPDTQHDLEHIENVKESALAIAERFKLHQSIDLNLLQAICLLHDMAYENRKTGVFTYLFEPILITKILKKIFRDVSINETERKILSNAIIRHPHSYPFGKLNRDQDIYTKILQDADTLQEFNENRKEKLIAPIGKHPIGKFIARIINSFFKYGRKHIAKYLNLSESAKVYQLLALE